MNKLGLKRGMVELISEYDFWNLEYEKEKNFLQQLLGNEILGIEHIGSTSIPHLLAKPIIDILLGVKDLQEVNRFREKLVQNGYEYRENGSDTNQILFVKGNEDCRTHYLHISKYDSKRWKDDLFFRDFLGSNEEYRQQYQELKVGLQKDFSDKRENYTKGKEEFIKGVLSKRS